jgi:hypothetical protein
MDCQLTRIHYLSTGIFGKIETPNVDFWTCEHAYSTYNDTWQPKVAPGIYKCVRHMPDRLPYVTFVLENVPDFRNQSVSGILIHIGNFNQDSIGCILIGEDLNINVPMITKSKQAFAQFMALQEQDEFTLTIS